MNNEDMLPMIPWFRDFKGYVRTTAKQKFDTVGVARKVDDTTIEITELPINKWNQAFKAELEALIEEKGEPLIKVCSACSNATPFSPLLCRTTRSTMTRSTCTTS